MIAKTLAGSQQPETRDRSIAMNIATSAIAGLMAVTIIAALVSHLSSGSTATLAFGIEVISAGLALGGVLISLPVSRREARDRRLTTARAIASEQRTEQLFAMTDMLQSATSQMDANSVLRATAERLLAGFGGALYVLNNSRDRLDLSTTWNWPEDKPLTVSVSPSHCWTLKRGKAHINGLGPGVLRCEHHTAEIAVLELPMMARGEVYGMLKVQADGPEPEARLKDVAPIASAIADGMSLALSNISLREKLRTQALRDPLTALYNRRYMEDMLERFFHLAERNRSAVSVVMIDLDHFKRLNDEYGHAKGDAVLRDVAAAIVGALRQTDVACRYGGEELVVLLPDCELAEATRKAEVLRLRIEGLSEVHGAPVTASFGVASIPETGTEMRDLIATADGALYKAKQAGRNRIVCAERRPTNFDEAPALVAAE